MHCTVTSIENIKKQLQGNGLITNEQLTRSPPPQKPMTRESVLAISSQKSFSETKQNIFRCNKGPLKRSITTPTPPPRGYRTRGQSPQNHCRKRERRNTQGSMIEKPKGRPRIFPTIEPSQLISAGDNEYYPPPPSVLPQEPQFINQSRSSISKSNGEITLKARCLSEKQTIHDYMQSEGEIAAMRKDIICLSVFIPHRLQRKIVEVPLGTLVSELVDLVLEVNTSKYHIYIPRTGIILPSDAELLRFQFSSDQLEDVKTVIVKNQATRTEEEIPFFPQTTVHGIWQLLKQKHLRNNEFGLFKENGQILTPNRPFSSYGKNLQEIFYAKITNETLTSLNKGFVLLKILLVESSGSKMMKFGRDITIGEAVERISGAVKLDKRFYKTYRLFIPLGAPLENLETLERLEFCDNDVLEFKRLPPHLVQIETQKQHSLMKEPLPSNILDWKVEHTCKWITCIGFGEYVDDFRRCEVVGGLLFSLTHDSLRDELCIMASGTRRVILREVRKLAVATQINMQALTPTKSTKQRTNSNSILWKQLVGTPLLATSDSYEVEDRGLGDINASIIEIFSKKMHEAKAWEHEGIFRLSGSKELVEKIYASLKNATPNFDNATIHDLGSSLKHYLRSLEDPLIPMACYDGFIACYDRETTNFDSDAVKKAIKSLPDENRNSYRILAELCERIAQNQDHNKMTTNNLGIVFAPTFMRSRDPYIDFSNASIHGQLFKFTLENFCDMF